jgi:deoxyuridine 5'-triphosphate nucleotidohydrolase
MLWFQIVSICESKEFHLFIIKMTAVWYELEILSHNDAQTFYPIAIMNRSDANAGFDLFSSENVHVEQTPVLVPFGITVRLLKVEPMPHGMQNEVVKTDSHFLLMPRSSIYKSGLLMANSTGVIDKSYRGELKAPVWSMTGNSSVQVGDRLFQIVAPDMGWIRHVRLVDSLPDTERGAGGFGSTGK